MENVTLTCNGIGENGFMDLRNQLSEFVYENFNILYEGAVRLNLNISNDYYAPQRVQINSTRLHASRGLKIADGHHIDADYYPSETQLIQTIADIQKLLDAAGKNIAAPFQISIIKEAAL